MYPVVTIECTERGIAKKADVLECRHDRMRVVVHGTEMPIDLRREGQVYVGRLAGMEFTCRATLAGVNAQKQGL